MFFRFTGAQRSRKTQDTRNSVSPGSTLHPHARLYPLPLRLWPMTCSAGTYHSQRLSTTYRPRGSTAVCLAGV
uniref:Uncharacterized protein n=1 Tax=Anguilla anguilla TaxID=7936 RepID=A0A0E9W6F7_ANGAN